MKKAGTTLSQGLIGPDERAQQLVVVRLFASAVEEYPLFTRQACLCILNKSTKSEECEGTFKIFEKTSMNQNVRWIASVSDRVP